MNQDFLSVRELTEQDIHPIIEYWLSSDSVFFLGMGVELNKIPDRNQWKKMLTKQLNTPIGQKESYCIIWLVNKEAVGHSNVSKIIFGEEAYMHLHLWNAKARKKGYGTELVKMTLPYFFQNLKLKRLFCEPYALNLSPNKTLEKVGFKLVKNYVTTPGWLNFEQPVNRWMLELEEHNLNSKASGSA